MAAANSDGMMEVPSLEAESTFLAPLAAPTAQDVDYFSVVNPGEVSQNLDVSTGPTGTLIASGEAAVVLSGFFTSYNGQDNRHGTMQVDFLNAGGTSLGSTLITSLGDANPWHQERGAAALPVGTATLRTSLFGNAFNAYIDNVDVRVLNAADALIFGDLNSDGKIDSLDWVIVRTNQETDLSGLTLEQAYLRGDLTEDLANNHADFVVFKNLYEAANGGRLVCHPGRRAGTIDAGFDVVCRAVHAPGEAPG